MPRIAVIILVARSVHKHGRALGGKLCGAREADGQDDPDRRESQEGLAAFQ